MSTLEFTVLGLDFPVGSTDNTATLVTGEGEAMLVKSCVTPRTPLARRENPRSGRKPTAVIVGHGHGRRGEMTWG